MFEFWENKIQAWEKDRYRIEDDESKVKTDSSHIAGSSLQFRFEKNDETETSYLKSLKEFCNTHTLLNSEPSSDNKTLKLTYDIVLKEEKDVNNFILDISKNKGVSEASIVAAQNDVDY